MIMQLSLSAVNNVVGGSNSMCKKTALSAAATICGGAGTMLQAFGQALHVNIPTQQPVVAGVIPEGQDNPFQLNQRRWGIGLSVTGLVLNIATLALSTLSASEKECVNT